MEDTKLVSSLLAGSASIKASDIHLRVGSPAVVRVDGRLAKLNMPPLTSDQLEEIILMTSGRRVADTAPRFWEYSFERPETGRFRGHVFRENGSWAVVLRVMPLLVPSFQDLHLPPVVKTLAERAPGLTLITGPTGSGKSTTAAAMLEYAATREPIHIMTLEDPIEFRIRNEAGIVSQREIGRDAASYEEALQSALREDPDVLFVGEIRDARCLAVVIQAAETGHTVLSTFHTGSALKTVQRLLAMLAGAGPDNDLTVSRARLADALRGVLCQRLLPRRGTRGRVVCCESLINNYAVKECLKDATKLPTLPTILERSGDQQMHTFDQHLAKLVVDGQILPDIAVGFASSPGDMKRNLRLQNFDA
jgi:twitching motility protein PilT